MADELALKLVVVGNGAVGKSSLIQRFCRGVFSQSYKQTIGVDFLERVLEIGSGRSIRLMVWDTAGQEEFDALTRAYYRGAHGAILAFSSSDLDSFEAVDSWRSKVEAECGSLPMVLVQNKMDLADQATVTPEMAECAARRHRLRLYRTSAKQDFNVDEAFRYLAEKCMEALTREFNDNLHKQASLSQSNNNNNNNNNNNTTFSLKLDRKPRTLRSRCIRFLPT
ncbi:ras-related protein Rab-23-like [Varroa jacobsoni]|uniref:Ras-related protein Rab-23 n=1 Tax=Varroa destructor TaxID=109461 RepID=A0A7M7K096_VARDE|nr:ras-related protein Rab-23-like [Varroa destructor]XP_022659453.1 ras-related protein Rab-23-like [Varroa destructor]XP_022659454.1 ras-related protein Rab-23-like [Varroa destructor]XP_022692163.1 ras-related protein Rab-23-like [Varroa jacobsoni]